MDQVKSAGVTEPEAAVGPVARLEARLKRVGWLPFLILALACGLVWGRTLSFDFVWDDRYFIVQNDALRSPSRALDLFTREDTQHGVSQHMNWGVYRPLRTLHWAALTWVGGRPIPALFHAANLVWHTVACALLFLLLSRLGALLPESLSRSRRSVALVLALAFCVHPINAEVVSWAKSMDDSLALALFLGALLAAWRAWERETPHFGWAALSLGLHLCALLSKESVVTLAPLFLLPVLFRSVRKAPFAAWLAGQFALAVGFVAVRHQVMGGTAQVTRPLSGSYGQTLVDMLRVPLMYGRAMLGIPPSLADYSFMEKGVSPLAPESLGGALLLLAVLAVTAVMVRKVVRARVADESRGRAAVGLAAALGLSWMLLALVPVSNLVPMMQYFAERFVYLPLAGVMLALMVPAARLANSRPKVFAGVAGVLLLGWGAMAFQESGKWRNTSTLMSHGYLNGPPSSRIVVNYLAVLDARKDDAAISAVIDRHRDLLKTQPEAEWMSAKSAFRQGRLDEGRERLLKLMPRLKLNGDYTVDLGVAHAVTGRAAEARAYFVAATKGWPNNPRGWENLGVSLNEEGRHAVALKVLLHAVELDASAVNSWKALSLAAWKTEDWSTARRALEQLAEREPENREHRALLQSIASR